MVLSGLVGCCVASSFIALVFTGLVAHLLAHRYLGLYAYHLTVCFYVCMLPENCASPMRFVGLLDGWLWFGV